jgi:hypothetical protein
LSVATKPDSLDLLLPDGQAADFVERHLDAGAQAGRSSIQRGLSSAGIAASIGSRRPARPACPPVPLRPAPRAAEARVVVGSRDDLGQHAQGLIGELDRRRSPPASTYIAAIRDAPATVVAAAGRGAPSLR